MGKGQLFTQLRDFPLDLDDDEVRALEAQYFSRSTVLFDQGFPNQNKSGWHFAHRSIGRYGAAPAMVAVVALAAPLLAFF